MKLVTYETDGYDFIRVLSYRVTHGRIQNFDNDSLPAISKLTCWEGIIWLLGGNHVCFLQCSIHTLRTHVIMYELPYTFIYILMINSNVWLRQIIFVWTTIGVWYFAIFSAAILFDSLPGWEGIALHPCYVINSFFTWLNIVYMLTGPHMNSSTKYEVNPTKCIGGVWWQTDKQTDTEGLPLL